MIYRPRDWGDFKFNSMPGTHSAQMLNILAGGAWRVLY